MDFIGLRSCEHDPALINAKFFSVVGSLLYDSTYRRTESEELKFGHSLGMLAGDPGSYVDKFPIGVVQESSPDEYEKVSFTWMMYLNIEPRYVSMFNDNQCDQRRESLRRWLACKSSALKFTTHLPDIICEKPEMRDTFVDPILNRLRKLFMALPFEVVHNPRLAVHFPLPVLLRKSYYEKFYRKVLISLCWWREITNKIHPVYCRLRKQQFGDTSSDLEQQLIVEAVLRCRNYDSCLKEMEGEPSKTVIQVIEDDKSKVFTKRKIFSDSNRRMIEDISMVSTCVAHESVVYLTDIKNGGDVVENFRHLVERTYSHVVKVEETAKSFYRRWYDPNKIEENFTGTILERIGRLVSAHANRTFFFVSRTGDRAEVMRETLHRVQKFVYWIMNAVTACCVHYIYSNFTIVTKESWIKDTVESLNLYVTWTAMNVILEETIGKQTWQQVPKQEEIKDAFRVVTADIVSRSLPIVYETLKECEAHLFVAQVETSLLTAIPYSLIYDDFTLYLKVLGFGKSCCHPLTELDGHTGGRLHLFCRDILVCFQRCRPTLEAALQQAESFVDVGEKTLDSTMRKQRVSRHFKSAFNKIKAIMSLGIALRSDASSGMPSSKREN